MSGLVNVTGAVSGVVGTSVGTPAGGVEADTVMVFHQSAAPTGWTKLSASGTGTDSVNNICLRCVTGNITDGVGGTVAMTTAFASQAVAAHTVATNELSSHTHNIEQNHCTGQYTCSGNIFALGPNPGNYPHSAVAHICACGGGAGHSHTAIDLAVKYVDVIIADKD
jgi:hypothetical protein